MLNLLYYITIMDEYIRKDFSKIIKANALEGRRWMRATDSEAVRIYDRNLPAFPVTIELYGKYAKVVDYSEEGMDDESIAICKDLISRMVYVEENRIIFQARKKREGIEQHTKEDAEPLKLEVKENGLSFEVDLTSHIDTGLFLDMVNVRSLVKDMAKGMRVLNLFSYTASFSVYAASGMASRVVSVDMSNTYSEIAYKNLERNGLIDAEKFPIVVKDALSFIDEEVENRRVYDIIIFDPPSFSNSHKMDKPFDIQKDYLSCIYKLNKLLSQNGVLIFSTNLSTFALEKKYLKQAFKVREITEDIRALGFVKSKMGQSRVWLMEKTAEMKAVYVRKSAKGAPRREMEEVKDELLDKLVLSMEGGKDEDVKASDAKKRERRGERRDFSDRKPRDFSDRPRRDRDERRDFSDRPRRDRDERRSGFDRRGRDFDDRPRFSDDRRSYDRRGRDFRDRDDRRSAFDRPRRDFDRDDYPRRDFEERPRRDSDRDDRPRRDFRDRDDRRSYDRPRRDYDDRPRRDFDRDDRPRRDYRDRDDRPRFSDDRRSFDRRGRDFDRPSFSERPRYGSKDKKGSVKPYGYDNIRSSRKRDDSAEDSSFFWRNKEEENK